MKVYITYFRYDHGEEYSIYNLDTSLKRSLKHWDEEDHPSFLSYGPDDISQLYLVKCSLPVSDVETLKNYMTSEEDYDKKFYDLMKTIDDIGEEICCTNGDEVWEVLDYFCKYYKWYIDIRKYVTTVPTDKDELREVLQDILFDDDKVWDKVIKDYLKN
jgi:hypothetical protein